MKKAYLFLTAQEAIEAILIDFRQYDPQTLMFSEVIRLLSDHRMHIKRESGKDGAWINRSGKAAMEWLEGRALVDYMCSAVENASWNLDLLSEVSSRVFQTRVAPACHRFTRQEGVCIETNMEAYQCRQCGRCCQVLDYHNEVTEEDVVRWKATDRQDILKWVQPRQFDGEDHGYRIWVVPGSHKLAETCPFLSHDPATNRWKCKIHDVKPAICRQYPVSRKHAALTGCRGFEPVQKESDL